VVKKDLGGRATNMSVPEPFDVFSRSIDIDTAKTTMHDIFYATIEELAIKDIRVLSKLREHLAKLKLLNTQIVAVESKRMEVAEERIRDRESCNVVACGKTRQLRYTKTLFPSIDTFFDSDTFIMLLI